MYKIKPYLIIIFLLIAPSCDKRAPKFESFSGFTQGTTYSVIYLNSINIDAEEMKNRVEVILDSIDNSLSTYNPNSLISAINANRSNHADSLVLNVLNRSYQIWEMTGGAFDITAGLLVNAWGFGPDSQKKFDESMLDSLMNLVGMDKIRTEGSEVIKSNRSMYLDLNAIAQGYSVDIVCKCLSSFGINSFLVEIGGEVRTRGTKDEGKPWKVAIDKPYDNNMIPGQDIQAIIKLTGQSLATSGNYRKFYEEDGVKYSHTIDPKSGYPVRHKLLSATIIANDCMTADAFATACMVVGPDNARVLIEKYDFLEGYLVSSDENGEFRIWYSDDMLTYLDE